METGVDEGLAKIVNSKPLDAGVNDSVLTAYGTFALQTESGDEAFKAG